LPEVHYRKLQVFQGAAEKVKKATESVADAAPSISAPSFSLPKFNAPSISFSPFSESGDIDPRAVALPGQVHSQCLALTTLSCPV